MLVMKPVRVGYVAIWVHCYLLGEGDMISLAAVILSYESHLNSRPSKNSNNLYALASVYSHAQLTFPGMK